MESNILFPELSTIAQGSSSQKEAFKYGEEKFQFWKLTVDIRQKGDNPGSIILIEDKLDKSHKISIRFQTPERIAIIYQIDNSNVKSNMIGDEDGIFVKGVYRTLCVQQIQEMNSSNPSMQAKVFYKVVLDGIEVFKTEIQEIKTFNGYNLYLGIPGSVLAKAGIQNLSLSLMKLP